MEMRVSKIEKMRQALEAKVKKLNRSVERLTQLAAESEDLYSTACSLRTVSLTRQNLVSNIHTAITQTLFELQVLEQESADSEANSAFSHLRAFLRTQRCSGRKRRKALFSVTAS
jgi:short-subunit dehydrogenase